MARLRVTSGKSAGKTIDFDKAVILGRGETAQLEIDDNKASREHCKVFEQAGQWVVADLNSRNGIKVNGVQASRKNLSQGDTIEIGETKIVFETAGAASKSAAAPAAGKPGAGTATAKKEAAMAEARAAAAKAAGTGSKSAGTKTAARSAIPKTAEGGGIAVSDRVLQFNKVDAKSAGLTDIDLTQASGGTQALIWIVCLVVLGAILWAISAMMA